MNKMVDMAMKQQERRDGVPSIAMESELPVYPYGLSISLTNDELEKLGLEADCEVGDVISFDVMAKVTCVSETETTSGKSCRIELQITHMGFGDDDEVDSHRLDKIMEKRYGK